MPLNEIPKYFNPETRRLVDAALEDAWQELFAIHAARGALQAEAAKAGGTPRYRDAPTTVGWWRRFWRTSDEVSAGSIYPNLDRALITARYR